MSSSDSVILEITPQVLLKAYACGIFPMAESADDPGMFWVEPEHRGILPLDDFHISRSLKKTLRRDEFEVRINTQFDAVVTACSQSTETRPKTWINKRIRELYSELHTMGHGHSVETWQDGELIGGLYGIHLGAAFFGESMFSRRTDASKVALVHLVYQLTQGGFRLLDTQFTTPHLEKFGVTEVPRETYQEMLDDALKVEARFPAQVGGATSDSILQFFSQMS